MAHDSDKIIELIEKVAAGQAETNAKIEAMLDRLNRQEEAVFGNGQPGLKQQVSNLEQRQEIDDRTSARRLHIALGSFTLINVAVAVLFHFI